MDIVKMLREEIEKHNALVPSMDYCDVMSSDLEKLYDSIVSDGHELTLYNGFMDDGGAGVVSFSLDGVEYSAWDFDM